MLRISTSLVLVHARGGGGGGGGEANSLSRQKPLDIYSYIVHFSLGQ